MPTYRVEAKVANSKHRTIETAEVTAPNRAAAEQMFRAAQPKGSRVSRIKVQALGVPKPPTGNSRRKAESSRNK